jgi:4-alpha-glucanotransferase
MSSKKASGILLHITSLPSKYGIGDLGPAAYRFADFLVRAKQSCWQLLPLVPFSAKAHYSPYNGLSAFAGNTMLISPQLLYQQGLLTGEEIQSTFTPGRVNYRLAVSCKTRLLNAAFERFRVMPDKSDYEQFCSENKGWLEDFAVFIALRRHFAPQLWCEWPTKLRNRNKQALKCATVRLRDAVESEKFLQFVFFKQYFELRAYCNKRGIRIIGDIPIYVSYDSADLWSHREVFKLTKRGKPRFVSGVPPDKFSQTGQLWNNPVYDWRALKGHGYKWWMRRVKHNLTLFDIVRIDHFRGLVAYWQVPAGSKTAAGGKWVKGPGEDFFRKLLKHCPSQRIIAEDLGYITYDVRALIKKFELAGTRVLQFAFDTDAVSNTHHPCNHIENCVVYTGTHDNNPIRGWFERQATPEQKKRLFDYLDRKVPAGKIHQEFIRMAMDSVADMVIIPMQDVLGLGEQARMNRPGTVRGNWRWQLRSGRLRTSTADKLAELTKLYGRA